MSKKILWPEATLHNAPRRPGTHGSMREAFAKSAEIANEQEQAKDYLQKAHAPMVKLLQMRLAKGDAIFVMRPLNYTTSAIPGDDGDDGFYKSSSVNDKFVDIPVVINPGTSLVLKSLDPNLQEFIFVDGLGKEHSISYSYRNLLLTQTNIFEDTKNYLEQIGDINE